MGGMPGAYDEGLTDAIIQGRGGGETLRMETALFGVREKVSNRAIKRLRDAVVSRTLGASFCGVGVVAAAAAACVCIVWVVGCVCC
jgi:hypothetical protein